MLKPEDNKLTSEILKHKACLACHFYRKTSAEFGECRKNAPITDAYGSTKWPRVNDEDWCGEFDYDFKNFKIITDV